MKKGIITSLLATFSLFAFSQTSSGLWNSSTAKYTNSDHKITWQLIEGLGWIGRPILSGSTLLKVRNDDTRILVKLGANKEVGLKGDIWDHVSEFESPLLDEMYKLQAQQNGMTYLGVKSMRSLLCGNHAIRMRIDMKKDYPEYRQTVHCVEIQYMFYKGNYLYSVSVVALSALEEEIGLFEKLAAQLFNGFNIN